MRLLGDKFGGSDLRHMGNRVRSGASFTFERYEFG